MSFSRLLAAGGSLFGLRKRPEPDRMNQGSLLPKFSPDGHASETVGTEAKEGAGMADVAASGAAPERNHRRVSAPRRTAGRSALGRLMARVARWGRRRSAGGGVAGAATRVVQAELSLDRLQVVRNDLSEIAPEAAKLRGRQQSNEGAPLGMVWNRLSARLLRQAAQEFNLIQKERGKLLSQTGPGGGGAEGA